MDDVGVASVPSVRRSYENILLLLLFRSSV